MDEIFDGGSLFDFMLLQTMLNNKGVTSQDKATRALALIFQKYNVPVTKGFSLLIDVVQVLQSIHKEGDNKNV